MRNDQNYMSNFKFTQIFFPNTFKVMDLNKFLEQNINLRKKIVKLTELNQARKVSEKPKLSQQFE